jgi:hypothetical protein
MAEPLAEVPAPAVRQGSWRRGGSRAEAMPALCKARRNVPFRMSWRSVNCAAREEHRMPWSVSERCRVDPQHGGDVEGLDGEAEAVLEGSLELSALESRRVLILMLIYVYICKHTRRHYAFSSTQQVHSQQHSKRPHGHDRHRQAKRHK